jgi:hypothetical protein
VSKVVGTVVKFTIKVSESVKKVGNNKSAFGTA